MQSRDFVYWLMGFLELNEDQINIAGITPRQAIQIKQHLDMVFIHEIDPSIAKPGSEEDKKLDQAHNPIPERPVITRPPGTGILRC